MDTEEETTSLLPSNNERQRSDHPTLKVQILAGFCAFLCSIIFSSNNLLIQAYNLHCTDLLILRSFIQVIIFGTLLKVQNITWWPSRELYSNVKDYIFEVILVIMQAVSNEIVMVMTWLTMSLMPIGDAMALIYTCPIFVIILSFFLLRQKFGLYRVVITLLTILGAVFIVNPSILVNKRQVVIAPHYYLGVVTSLIVAFFGGVNTVVVYRLRNFHVYALLFTSGLLGLFLSLIMCPLDPLSQIFHDTANANYPFLILSGSLGVIGLLLCIYSGQILTPIIYAILRCQEIVLAFMFQSFISMQIPSWVTILGALLVVLSTVLIPLENLLKSVIPWEKLKKII